MQWLKSANFNGANGAHFVIALYYDLEQSTVNNNSKITYYLYFGCADGYSAWGDTAAGQINGTTVGYTSGIGVNEYNLIGTLQQTVTHDSFGHASASYSASLSTTWGGVGSASLSGTFDLPDIPRGFTKTPKATLNKGDSETKLRCVWETSENCNKIQYRYKINTATAPYSSWTTVNISPVTTESYFDITGLNVGTAYLFQFKFTRADTNVSSGITKQQTTYSYPYISTITPSAGTTWSMSGSSETVAATLYNPLNRSIKVYISVNSTSGTKIVTFTTGTGTSFSASLSKTTINNAITTAQSATLVYWCEYSTNGSTYTASSITRSNTYQLREADCIPTLGSLTYDDGNSTTRGVINNSGQTLVQNYSILSAKLASATGKYNATISSIKISFGTKTADATAGTAVSLGTFDYTTGSNYVLTATVTDSRGFTNSVTKNVTFISYSPPQVSVKAERTNGYGTTATFKVSASYTQLTIGGNNKNAWLNSNAAYVRYAISPAPTTPAASGNLSNANPINNLVTNITGANNDNTYTITIYANDKITSASATTTFGKGQPTLGVFVDNQTVTVNTVTNVSDASGLYVNGVSNLTGNTTITGNLTNVTGTAKVSGTLTTAAISGSGQFKTTNNTASSSTSTGSIVTSGGIGVAKNSYFGGNINVAGSLTIGNKTLLDLTYPVGSVYISVSSTSPATLFGGTWVAFATGRTLVGINTSDTDFKTVEKTGGEKTHKLTVNEMPSHTHDMSLSLQRYGNGSATAHGSMYATNMGGTIVNENTGGDQAHNNLQPYITVYMWKRTA